MPKPKELKINCVNGGSFYAENRYPMYYIEIVQYFTEETAYALLNKGKIEKIINCISVIDCRLEISTASGSDDYLHLNNIDDMYYLLNIKSNGVSAYIELTRNEGLKIQKFFIKNFLGNK